MRTKTAREYVDNIIRSAKMEERTRILNIIRDMPNLEENYIKLLSEIETPKN